MTSKCARCGEASEDLRTLWMSCLYAMHELGIPFERRAVRGTAHKYIGERGLWEGGQGYPGVRVDEFAGLPIGDPIDLRCYTLRVCKACRSDWLGAVGAWFAGVPIDDKESGERLSDAPLAISDYKLQRAKAKRAR